MEQFGRDTFLNCMGSDISETGIGFVTDTPLEIHSQFFFMATLECADGPRTIKGKGIALYCSEKEDDLYRVGMEFVEMDEQSERDLHDFINSEA